MGAARGSVLGRPPKSVFFVTYANWKRGEANPTRADRLLQVSEVGEHRHFDCARYDECLSVVAAENWPSFSCRLCPVFARAVAREGWDGET